MIRQDAFQSLQMSAYFSPPFLTRISRLSVLIATLRHSHLHCLIDTRYIRMSPWSTVWEDNTPRSFACQDCGPKERSNDEATGRRTDSGRGGNGGVGNVVMKASRSEAAREAVRADESNLPHARRQAGETELRRGRCGGSDVAGTPTPTQRPRKPSKRGRARCGTDRTGLNLAVLRRRGGLWGGDRIATLGSNNRG